MTASLEAPPRGGLGRLVVVAVVFGLFAPAPLFGIPLAALLVASRAETRVEWVVATVGGGLSLWWLLLPGELPEQVVRTAAVLSAAASVAASLGTRATFIHRALLAVAVATLAIATLFLFHGWSWDELRWWVEYRTGYATRLAFDQLRAAGGAGGVASDQLDAWVSGSVAFVANNFPALVALQIVGGLALAAALYYRLASRPRGLAPGPPSEFRVTEHLGWAAAIPLVGG